MNKPYYLFLDDERYPKQVTWVNLPLVDWVIVRNYNEFVKKIEEDGMPVFISFDHDLADEHYNEAMSSFVIPCTAVAPAGISIPGLIR